jgi:hypothetical protein
MNAVHNSELSADRAGHRGKLRDALTLFDESGVILFSTDAGFLEAVVERDWNSVFRDRAPAWHDESGIFVVGHALLEKFLQPYKSITAHALLLRVNDPFPGKPRASQLSELDENLAARLLDRSILDSPAGLSPVPLMGIPGWWPIREQTASFYEDQQVFRPRRKNGRKAPIYTFIRPC